MSRTFSSVCLKRFGSWSCAEMWWNYHYTSILPIHSSSLCWVRGIYINSVYTIYICSVHCCGWVWQSVSQTETTVHYNCTTVHYNLCSSSCAVSIIFIIWTSRQFKFVDCQSVSSTFIWLWYYEKQCCAFLLGFLRNMVGLSGLERPVGGWCFLAAALLHHLAGHHGAATTLCQ